MNRVHCPRCGRFMRKDETYAYTASDKKVQRRWECPTCGGERFVKED